VRAQHRDSGDSEGAEKGRHENERERVDVAPPGDVSRAQKASHRKPASAGGLHFWKAKYASYYYWSFNFAQKVNFVPQLVDESRIRLTFFSFASG
jgi:hypothetical protein